MKQFILALLCFYWRHLAFDFRGVFFAFDLRVVSPLFALFRIWLLRFFAFDFRVFSHLTFAFFRLNRVISHLIFAFFAFICVISHLTFAFFTFIRVISPLTLAEFFFCLYSRYFAFDFCVFSPLFAVFRIWLFAFFRLWLSRFFAFIRISLSRFFAFICFFCLYVRYNAFIGVITPFNSALLRIHSRYNAFQFGVITPLFAF